MEILVALLFVWVVVTLVGHGSWVLLRAIFGGTRTPDLPPTNIASRQRQDVTASRRVISRLHTHGLIDQDEAARLQQKVHTLDSQRFNTTQPQSVTPPPLSPATPVEPRPSSATDSPTPVQPHPLDPQPTVDVNDEQPVLAILCDESSSSDQSQPAASPTFATVPQPSPASPLPPAPPALSKSEIIRSFLAAHNIRWGELAAGILIVTCSIGLVINLWSTLVATHRVMPSLIFLGANAAIYAAGLYTLSRWRLRHTSRAVLVIATLLVPLSVLAGLAAAGTSDSAVQLNDPITLAAIVIAGSIYGALLYWGGKALTGLYAPHVALSVAGPVFVLPFIPAAVRTFGAGAGWSFGLGSAAIVAALTWMIKMRRREDATLGVVGSRNRLLVMAFAGFALAASVGYGAFAVHTFGLNAYLPIAIVALPALVALSAAGRSLMLFARGATHSMIGAVTCILLVGICWTVLPATMSAPRWLWLWASVLSLSGMTIGWILKQPRWLPASTLPLGLAAILSSPSWLGGKAWESIPFWTRLIGGEPMLAATLVAVTVGVMTALIRDRLRNTWMMRATCFWIGEATVAAGVLAIGPERWLGIAPWWSVTAVLSACAIASVYFSSRHDGWSWAVIAGSVLVWCSVFRPFATLGGEEALFSWDLWMITALATAISLSAVRHGAARIKQFRGRSIIQSAKRWQHASTASCVIALAIACSTAWQDWKISVITAAAVTAILFWESTSSRSLDLLRLSQLASVACVILMGYGQFGEHLFDRESWKTGHAFWGWGIAAALVTACWFAVRELSRGEWAIVKRRLQYTSQSNASPLKMVDGLTAITAGGLVALGAAWSFAALLARASEIDSMVSVAEFALPLAAIVPTITVGIWLRRLDSTDDQIQSSLLVTAVFVATTLWASTLLSGTLPIDSTAQLIVATTVAAVGCLLIHRWGMSISRLELAKEVGPVPLVTCVALIAISSGVLLTYGWIRPIIDHELAHRLPTASVATWWLIGAAALFWIARRNESVPMAIASATLTPAAIVLLVPMFVVASPVVWLQYAAITSLAWVVICIKSQRNDEASAASVAINGSLLWASATGLASAVGVILRILLDLPGLDVLCGPASVGISFAAVAVGCLIASGWLRSPTEFSTGVYWPAAITLLAGQAAWLASRWDIITIPLAAEILLAIWFVGSAISLARYQQRHHPFDQWHGSLIALAVMVFAVAIAPYGFAWMPWLGIASAVVLGLLVASVGNDSTASAPALIGGRVFGWATIILGILVIDRLGGGRGLEFDFTVVIAWVAAWVIGWRCLSADRTASWSVSARAIPDVEFAIVVMLASLSELAFFVVTPDASSVGMLPSLLAVRVVAYLGVGSSVGLRAGRDLVWAPAMTLAATTLALLALRIAMPYGPSLAQRAMLAGMTSCFLLAIVAYLLPTIARMIVIARTWVPDLATASMGHLARATVQVVCGAAAVMIAVSSVMMATGVPPSVIQLTIVSVGLLAWTLVQLAELTRAESLRHAAVTLTLMTIGLLASVDVGETAHPWLGGAMRWLVASVITTPMIMLVVPRLLGEQIALRWRPALRRATRITATAAASSLAVMLMIEVAVRGEDGIAGISRSMVIGVAVTLAILSLTAGLAAILSKKGTGVVSELLNLTDAQRRLLIIAAQAIGGLTWLHVFLCKTGWAFIGMRPYWPYIVMGIAFVSVAVTEWARRRSDRVLSDTLSQTALYLPLVPVVGFWLSGSLTEYAWLFSGGKVRYDVLLALGAVYYIGLSAMWKRAVPRIAAVVLGNAALWVVLVQRPDWSFLIHPQAWLIPPAVCVLVTAHLYRGRLQPATLAAIRYACTLVIYVSSTADLLLQEIGTNISGPIILILLALAGMLAGVILQVRPFLYLGAMFVFIGVTSMVWHAQRSIDAVWPWWVFGITTGICLLAGLMALEKNKDRLRQYANTLATWEG